MESEENRGTCRQISKDENQDFDESPEKDLGEVISLAAEGRALAASKDLGDASSLAAEGRTLAASSLTDVPTKANAGQGMNEDGSGKNGDETMEQYWFVYAIKSWTQEWFNQHSMESWSIDNYDGQGSYVELNMKLIARHKSEPPLEPIHFQQMRRHMLAIELEMDDPLNTDELMTKEREREWKGLRDLAISICDDYTQKCYSTMRRQRQQSHNKVRTYPKDNSTTMMTPAMVALAETMLLV